MSLWEQTNAFSFAPDFERKQAAPPQPAWTAKRVAITATSESAESLVATMVFAVYSKFEGDDAVLVVDGRPPTAIVNPFATLAEAPFTAALAEVTTARESTDPRADEMRKKIAKVLKERSQATTTDANRTTAIVGSGAVLLQRTVDHIGEVAAVHAFDSIFVLDEGVDEATFEVSILYNASIYASQTMEDRMDLLEMVRDAHAVNPAFVLRTDVSALTESMKLRLLRDWQPERIPVHIYHRTLPDVFIETVNERCGDPRVKHAVIEPSTGRTITYADMLLRARKLACYLQRKVPCDSWGSDATCGIHVPRCLDWYVMMLGVHLAGGAYLSLDPDFPPDRLLYTLQDSGAVCLLTLRSMVGSLGYEGPTFAVDELWSEIDEEDVPADFASPSTGTSPAYLIYTSGSTGKPKGVCIEHRNAVNFVESERRLFGIDNHHRVIQGFSTSFDASVEEIWLAFASGSSLVVVDKAVMQDADMLGQLVLSTQATILSTVPTLLATMDSKKVASLEMVIAGGEACNKDVVKAYATGGKRRFVNSYGPTEATVACMADFSTPDRPVTIGRPQPGYFACIVNERMELLPPGVPGELCMAGPSVARGYVNRPDLTEEKFCPCPYQSIPRDAFEAYDDATANDATFDRLYHTGDLTRWNIDGRVEFLGRIDSQVKLRGFRIEVGEIEAHLANFPGVKSAVVHLLQDNGHDYLCGYLMCDQTLTQNFQEHAFKDFLKDKLPTYMIPSRFCTVESYPRSPAGKLDRKQLPPPPPVAKQESDEPAKGGAPKNATERLVYDIWVELFPGMKLGTGDNFFEIGGHSLLAGKLASKIRQCGYQSFNIRMVYANPTVAEIAEALSKMERVNVVDETGASEVLRLPERFQPSLLRKTLFALWQMTFFTIGGIFSWAWLIIFALFVTLVEGPDSGASTWLEDRLNLYDIVVYGVIMQCIASIWSLFSMLVVAPIMKWVILGRAKPGMYSIWTFYYLRYWTSRSFTSNSFMLLSTEVHNLQLRSLGAKIGGSTIISAFIQDPDLVEIGEDCFIGDNVTLQTSQVVDSMLVLQPVTIGNCCSVGARSVISGGAVLEDEVMTVPLTVIPPNVIISSGEKWQGAPASRAGRTMPLSTMMDSTTRRGRPSEQSFLMLGSERAIHLSVCRRIGMGLMQFFFLFAVGLVSGGGVSGFFSLVMLNHMLIWGNHWYIVLLVMLSPVITGILMVWGHVWLVFLRYVVFPRTPVAGLYAIDSQMFQRKILFDIIARSSLMGAHPMYGSIFTQYYLRAMGCKVGRRVECSNLWGWTPGLTNFGDECFVADFVGVNPPEVFRGVMRLDKVDIGFRAFIGNGSVLPPGTVVEEKSLLGLASIPPNGRVYAGTTAIGSPAFEIPRKTSVDSVDQQRTFEPPRSLVIRRVIWETFRCVMPSTFITWSFMYAFMLLVFVFEDHSYVADGIASGKFVIILLLYVVFLWTNLLFSVFFAVASKWLIVGQHKAEENPLWSPGVWRSEFVVDVTTVVGGGGPIGFFRGTQFLCILFRMLGAKIGKECFVDTLYLTEPDLVTLGDGVCVNFNATLQTHLFEDRVMKMDTMEIKDRASVGCFAVVLYNTVVGRGCTIAPNTLVMKGESLPNYTHWQGSPAQKGQIPEVMRTTEAEAEQTVRLNIVPTLPRAEAPASPNVAGAGLRSAAEWLARSRRRSSNAAPLSKSFGEPSSGAL